MVDTVGDFAVALNRMLSQLRLPGIGRAEIEQFVGKGTEHLIRRVLSHAGAPAQLYDEARTRYESHYLSINGQYSQVYPGVAEGLAALRGHGWRLVCVTNKPNAFAGPLLEAKGLARHFEAVFGGDTFERKKPDPLPIVKACEALGTAPADTLAIGDSVNDAEAARAAGCPVVLVTYGYNHGQPARAIPADGFVDSLAELPAWLAAA